MIKIEGLQPACPEDERYKGIGNDCKPCDKDLGSIFAEGLSYYASAEG